MVEEFAFDNTEERRKTRQNDGEGWIEVIVGSMFSGKSEELIRRLRRAQIARQKVQVFKPVIDDRYSIEQIASHSGMTHVSKPVMTASERSFTLTWSAIFPGPTRHPSVTSVSPGQTGFVNFASKPVTFDASPPQAPFATCLTM